MAKTNKIAIISVMLCFFCMGFVDLVGIASNYVKEDLQLSDSVANIFPSLVFFWFLIFSVPTGMLMNKIGRKKTVLLSLVVTIFSLFIPLFGNSFPVMLIAFSLLGIGNALMQTSLNPLVSTVMGGGNLASTLTFGQFIKAIASFLAPYLAMWGATQVIPSLGLDWRVLFAIYFVVGVFSTVLLGVTPIHEEKIEGKPSTFVECFKLLGEPIVLLSFLGIMCHVGIDVGTNTTAPKILMERLGMTLNEAAFATSLYFIFRTIGCLTGSFFLRVLKMRTFFIISVIMMALSMCGMFFGHEKWILYTAIALVGYGNSNVFSMCFATALESMPKKQNEVSGLMIMGLFGGTIFPLLMGFASDAVGQAGAVAVMAIGVIYLFTYDKRYVVGLGEALWDVLPEGKKLGGAPANFAYHAGQFVGSDNSIAISALGEDKLAEETIEALEEHGLKYLMPRVPYPTGTVQVTLNEEGIPTYDIKENVAWDNIPFTPEIEEIAANCRAVCYGSLAQRNVVSRENIHRFLDATPNDCMKIFDINLRQQFYNKEIIQQSMRRCNILKINDEELVIIGRMFGYPGLDIENKCWLILGKYNLDMLVLTCGTNGSYVFTRGQMSFQETPKVEVADTVGAGDSFTGSFCAAILNGKPVTEAHELAVKVSAYVCTQNGAMPTLPPDLLAAAQ